MSCFFLRLTRPRPRSDAKMFLWLGPPQGPRRMFFLFQGLGRIWRLWCPYVTPTTITLTVTENCRPLKSPPFFWPVVGIESSGELWVLSIMPKIPEISVGIQMERPVSVSFDRNIRDHLWRWSAYFGRIPTEICRSTFHKPVLCPNKLGNSEEKFEMTRAISIGWPSLIGKCRSIFLRYSH